MSCLYSNSVGGIGTIAMCNRGHPCAYRSISNCEALHQLSVNVHKYICVFGKAYLFLPQSVQLHRQSTWLNYNFGNFLVVLLLLAYTTTTFPHYVYSRNSKHKLSFSIITKKHHFGFLSIFLPCGQKLRSAAGSVWDLSNQDVVWGVGVGTQFLFWAQCH